MRVDPARQHETPAGIDPALTAAKTLGERDNPAAADTDVAARNATRGGDGAAVNYEIERAHTISPSPRFAQKVIRCSATAKIAYMTMPRTAITNRPANTSGVSKFAVAAIIR